MHPFFVAVLKIYSVVNSQVIVAGMGEIIGIQQTAIHNYMERAGYEGLEYQCLFEKVIALDKKIRQAQNAARTLRTSRIPQSAPQTPQARQVPQSKVIRSLKDRATAAQSRK